MKIQLASDLHHDAWARVPSTTSGILPACEGAELLVLAGDIGEDPIAWANMYRNYPLPVLAVPGNHDFYHSDFNDTRRLMRLHAHDAGIGLLDNDEIVLNGVRFLGCTLWTDFNLDGNIRAGIEQWEKTIRDSRRVKDAGEPLTALRILAEHQRSRHWLESKLNEPFEGRTVVITHHAPSRKSLDKKYADYKNNSSFASNLDHLVEKADFWFHGHLHVSKSYKIGKCQVIANPRGYPMMTEAQEKRQRFAFLLGEDLPAMKIATENRRFDPAKLITV